MRKEKKMKKGEGYNSKTKAGIHNPLPTTKKMNARRQTKKTPLPFLQVGQNTPMQALKLFFFTIDDSTAGDIGSLRF